MRGLVSLIFIFLAAISAAQEVQTVAAEDFNGMTVTRSDTFTGQSLYGYIDGGADLYLEYGFVRLFVNEYSWNNEMLKTEIWVMNDGPSAYGIYALSHSSCLQWNSVSAFSCTSKYQVAAASGPLFISVTNNTGTSAAQEMCVGLIKKILEKNPQEVWYMPMLFQNEKLGGYANSIRFFKGPLGIQNGLPVMSNILEDLEFELYTLVAGEPAAASLVARFVFPDNTAARTFLSRVQLDPGDGSSTPVPAGNGMYRSWYKINDTKIIYMESRTHSALIKDFFPASGTPDQFLY